jgi:cytidylate kinase
VALVATGATTLAGTSAPRVVTISASYGAGGTVVGPRVAKRLDLPYLEHLVTPSVAAGPRDGRKLEDEERSERLVRRLARSLAGLPLALGAGAPQPVDTMTTEEDVRDEVEASITALASTTGGVVLGRAATVVLADWPGVFHVRLRGPTKARVRQAMAIGQLDEAEAARRLKETDRARALYLRRFYDRDADDPSLYHLVLDATAVPLDATTELVVDAASAFWTADADGSAPLDGPRTPA